MIVVVNDFVGPLRKAEAHPGVNLPGFEEATVLSETLDITVYHERYWKELVQQNVIQIIYCMAIPKEMVLLEKEPIKVELNFQRLKSYLYHIKDRIHTPRSQWLKGQIWAAKKYMLHSLRILALAHQLVNSGKIENYTVTNALWRFAASTHFDSFDSFLSWYKKESDALLDPLRDVLNCYKAIFDDLSKKTSFSNSIRFFDYLQLHCGDDLIRLEKELSFTSTVIHYADSDSGDENHEQQEKTVSSPLILFEKSFEWPRHIAIEQAYRVIAHRADTNWNVVAIGPKNVFEFGADRYVKSPDKFVDKIDFATAKLFRKPQGFGVLMFWHKNDWKVAFASSGFYADQYLYRYSLTRHTLGDHLLEPFWSMWERKRFEKPGKEAQSWTFQFVFHPDEDLLQLEAIVDKTSIDDISMADSRSKMSIEGGDNEPFLVAYAKSRNWDFLEQVPISFPSKKATTDAAIQQNYDLVLKMANGATEMELLKFEGFVLCDESRGRVQFSLPQYTMLTNLRSRYERKNRTTHFVSIVRATVGLPNGEERFCTYYPAWASWYRFTLSIFRLVCLEADEAFKPFSKISDAAEFREEMKKVDANNKSAFSYSKLFFRLRLVGVTSFETFTNRKMLNDSTTVFILSSWINHRDAFKSVQKMSTEELLS